MNVSNKYHVKEFFERCGKPSETLELIADWHDLRVLSLVGRCSDDDFVITQSAYRQAKDDFDRAKEMLATGKATSQNQHFMMTVYRPLRTLVQKQREIRRDAKELAEVARETLRRLALEQEAEAVR